MRYASVVLVVVLVASACAGAGTTTTSESAIDATQPGVGTFYERVAEFPTPGGFALSGTLSIPDGPGPFPGVVLVTGSGPQDRDETLGEHKPFLDISAALAASEVIVLRYDDRGVGESGGQFEGATTFDLADDAQGAVEFLSSIPDVDASRIGVIGHSEGALIAPLVAGVSDLVTFAVLLAPSGVVGRDLVISQQEDIARVDGVPRIEREWQASALRPIVEMAASDATDAELVELIQSAIDEAEGSRPQGVSTDLQAFLPFLLDTFTDPWMRAFLVFDPVPSMRALDIPTLVVLAELDVQASPALNEDPLREAFAENLDAEVVVLAGLNHLFLQAQTGSPSEYGELSGPTDRRLLDLLAQWILGLA